MIAYKYDENMRYVGTQNCQLDPLESKIAGHDVWLLPADCTFVTPLNPKEGYHIVWNGGSWKYEKITIEPEPETPQLTEEEIRLQRIESLKTELASSDYKTLKYIDGALTEEEYEYVKLYRADLRRQINELEQL